MSAFLERLPQGFYGDKYLEQEFSSPSAKRAGQG
jgi:hypothetical protein